MALVAGDEEGLLPEFARTALLVLADQLHELRVKINKIEREIHAWHRSNAQSRRLETAPGVGPITASAIVATVPDPSCFKSGRQFAAWLGLTPNENSTGGKQRLGRITRAGDPYLRRLLVVGAHAVLRHSGNAKSAPTRWAAELLGKKADKLKTPTELAKKRDDYLKKQAEAQFAVPEDQLVDAVRKVLARHGVTWG